MKLLLMAMVMITTVLAADGLSSTGGLFRGYTAGVIRPDEGTVEVALAFSKPVTEFGSADGQFIFAVKPSRKPGTDGNTLICLFMPPEPGRGLAALVRTGKNYYRVNMPEFSYGKGERVHLAMSWGRSISLYVNGIPSGAAPMNEPIGEEFIAHSFQADVFPPFNVDALKISTRELRTGEITPPGKTFAPDDDTAFIASRALSVHDYRRTRWHVQSGYHALMPAWRPERQVFTEKGSPVMEYIGIAYAPAAYQVSIRAYGSSGTEAFSTNTVITPPLDGKHRVFSVPLVLPGSDHYQVTTTMRGSGDAVYSNALSVLPRIGGADGALARYYGQHRDMDIDPSFFTALGARSTRAWAGGRAFLWHHIEPEQGRFEWKSTDTFVRECSAAGLTVLGLLGNPPRWAAEEPDEAHKKKHPLACRPERWKPKDVDAWGAYVYATVKRYKEVPHWEIYNEVNFAPPARPGSFSGSTEDYLLLLTRAYAEAKRANPQAQVLISGFSPNADRAMPISLIKLGALDHCDIFNIHGYSGVDGVKDWLAAYKREKPAMHWWQTEQMWFQIDDHKDRILPTIEYYVQFLAAGAQRYFNMGTAEVFADRYTYAPTSSYHVTGVFMEMLRTCVSYAGIYRFPGDDEFAARHRCVRTDGTSLSIFANEHAVITAAGSITAAYDSMGRSLACTADGENTLITVSNAAYIISAKPLLIKKAELHARKAVCRNGGFEEIDGDIGEGGLAAGKPRIWSYRDKSIDPAGAISLSTDAYEGKYALAVSSSGKGRVFAVQYTRIPAGDYVFSAFFKRGAGEKQKPHLQYNIADVGKKSEFKVKSFEITDEYRRYEWTITMPDVEALTLGVGMSEGSGTVLIDTVRFERVK